MKYLLLVISLIPCIRNNGQSSLPKDLYVILPFDKDAYTTLEKTSKPALLDDSDFAVIDYLFA